MIVRITHAQVSARFRPTPTVQVAPFDADLDIRHFAVSADGAIDFYGFRLGTNEKIHGAVAAGSTEVVVESAGTVEPAQVVAFTPID